MNIKQIADTLGENILSHLGWYDKDISEKEHAAEIVKLKKSYENDAKRELETLQKLIREWEDRFCRVVEHPSAFETVSQHTTEQQEEKKKNDKP
jgi:hypothetical protein